MRRGRRLGARDLDRSLSSESGSAVLETVVAVPAFALLVALVLLGARVITAEQRVETAANHAARAASIARSGSDAAADAERAAALNLGDGGAGCVTYDVTVDSSGLTAPAGQPASVTATVSCEVGLLDLAIPGIAATTVVHATSSSPVDQWRSRP